MRRLNDELLTIIQEDNPQTTNFSNTAVLYLNRQTFEQMKTVFAYNSSDLRDRIRQAFTHLLGIPIMLHHSIPAEYWELVQRDSGEQIISGYVWATEEETTE